MGMWALPLTETLGKLVLKRPWVRREYESPEQNPLDPLAFVKLKTYLHPDPLDGLPLTPHDPETLLVVLKSVRNGNVDVTL